LRGMEYSPRGFAKRDKLFLAESQKMGSAMHPNLTFPEREAYRIGFTEWIVLRFAVRDKR
jgi:hypothetical protein